MRFYYSLTPVYQANILIEETFVIMHNYIFNSVIHIQNESRKKK
jgi:hypothetical protein